jgi:phosphate-selective porin
MKKLKLSFVLLLIVAFSACTLKGNIAMNGKDIIIDQLKGLKSHKDLTSFNDTSNQEQLTGDFRYDYLLK